MHCFNRYHPMQGSEPTKIMMLVGVEELETGNIAEDREQKKGN